MPGAERAVVFRDEAAARLLQAVLRTCITTTVSVPAPPPPPPPPPHPQPAPPPGEEGTAEEDPQVVPPSLGCLCFCSPPAPRLLFSAGLFYAKKEGDALLVAGAQRRTGGRRGGCWRRARGCARSQR